MPSCEPGLIARGGDELDGVTIGIVLGLQIFDVQLRIGRIVGGWAGQEAGISELQFSVFQRESGKLGSRWSIGGVGLGIADGAVGADVDLLAPGHLDGLQSLAIARWTDLE